MTQGETFEERYSRLFACIGNWVTDGRVSIVPFTHWLSDVWIARSTDRLIWVKLLPTRLRQPKRKMSDAEIKAWPYIRMTADDFERRYKFVKVPTALLESLISDGLQQSIR